MYNHATVINLCQPYVAALLLLADIVSGQYTVFRPSGLSSLRLLDVGQGPDPLEWALHLTQVRVDSDPCAGLNDVLAVTFAAPVVGGISRLDWLVNVCPVEVFDSEGNNTLWRPIERLCERVVPTCAGYQTEGDGSERRTILLHGQFVQFEGNVATYMPTLIFVESISFLIAGHQTNPDVALGEDVVASGRGYGMCGLHTHRNAPSNAKCHVSTFVLEN